MSMLASFHLVGADRVGALLEAARPVREQVRSRFLFLSRTRTVERCPLWDWLSGNARELPDLPFSGVFLVYLDLLAEASGAAVLSAGVEDVSAALSERAGSTFAVFDLEHARRAIAILDGLDLSLRRVQAHLVEERGSAEPEDVESVAAARDWLRAALSQVTADTVGVLNVG